MLLNQGIYSSRYLVGIWYKSLARKLELSGMEPLKSLLRVIYAQKIIMIRHIDDL